MASKPTTTPQDLQDLPYVSYVPYNGTIPTGGNSLTQDLNVFYETGDIAWMLTSTALVLLMIPGVGFFYSGLARRKSALSLIWLSIMAAATVSPVVLLGLLVGLFS
jgi:Amt family ammonium transporter